GLSGDIMKMLFPDSFILYGATQMAIIRRVLSENQITDYFQVIVTGDQFKQSKPNPEIYHYTASQLNTPENQCLVIEDSTLGITAAYRAGMTVAALIDDRFGFDRSLAHHEIASLTEIPDLLKRL
ncbi:MAG: HAD-IA family hydrolase, partial [Hungatella sp.]|nr:HAD-IA family hydrolase [Hungatella sp.]